MKTFFNILQTVINKKNKTYPDEPFKFVTSDSSNIYSEEIIYIDFLINEIYYNQKKSILLIPYMQNAEAKFSSLNSILENKLYNKQLKEKLIYIFSKSQKYYYAFSKLSQIYKTKKYPITVSNDLMLNPLNIYDKKTFILIQNKSKYLFSVNDLVSIIETALSNSPNFFAEPLSPLNPYNKEPFSISTLYNIYFKLKESGRLISILFHLFFLEHFNKKQFLEKNEPVIREKAIKTYVYNSPYTILYSSVLTMLNSNSYTKKLSIHREFPKDILVEIFRPFLFYFFTINYDIKYTSKINIYRNILNIKLKKFYEYNKAFGRKYITCETRFGKVIKKHYQFNTKHISFYKIDTNKNKTGITQESGLFIGWSANNDGGLTRILLMNSYFDERNNQDDENNDDDDFYNDNDNDTNDDNDTNNNSDSDNGDTEDESIGSIS